MNGSLRLGRVAGIELFVHWTFLILIGWIVLSSAVAGRALLTTMFGLVFVLSIFACIVLHELSHALTAARYGIRTLDITLLPIGGIARLERVPDDPRQELWVALAGPAVNLVLAGVLLASSGTLHMLAPSSDLAAVGIQFLSNLMWINIGLMAFNMLPAFPMDGGRVLRALLAMRWDYARATRLAADIGKGSAIVLGVVGLFSNWVLVFIAMFVYMGAELEARLVATRTVLRDVDTRSAMVTQFHVLSQADTLEKAADEWLASMQPDFPVVDDGKLVGVLACGPLVRALTETGPDERVGNVMERDWPVVEDSDALETTFEKLREDGHDSLPVTHDGHLVGVVTMQSIGKWMKVHSVLDQADSPDDDLTWNSR